VTRNPFAAPINTARYDPNIAVELRKQWRLFEEQDSFLLSLTARTRSPARKIQAPRNQKKAIK
jgi:hypothetical protein